MQSYMAWGKAVTDMVAKTDLRGEGRRARAGSSTSILVDAMAPSNNPHPQPDGDEDDVDTGGKSAVSGLKNFLDDMTKNGGLPSSVDYLEIQGRARTSPTRTGNGRVPQRGAGTHPLHRRRPRRCTGGRCSSCRRRSTNITRSTLSPDKSHDPVPARQRHPALLRVVAQSDRRSRPTGASTPISWHSTKPATRRATSPAPTPSTSWAPAPAASRCRPMSPGCRRRSWRRSTPSSWRSACSTRRPTPRANSPPW